MAIGSQIAMKHITLLACLWPQPCVLHLPYEQSHNVSRVNKIKHMRFSKLLYRITQKKIGQSLLISTRNVGVTYPINAFFVLSLKVTSLPLAGIFKSLFHNLRPPYNELAQMFRQEFKIWAFAALSLKIYWPRICVFHIIYYGEGFCGEKMSTFKEGDIMLGLANAKMRAFKEGQGECLN